MSSPIETRCPSTVKISQQGHRRRAELPKSDFGNEVVSITVQLVEPIRQLPMSRP